MNANEIINNSFIAQIGINDSDKSLDGSKTFVDAKAAIAKAIDTIAAALPKMKAAGTDMSQAADQAEGLFRSIVRKGWGGNEVEFYVTRDGDKAITAIGQRTIDDIAEKITNFVANY